MIQTIVFIRHGQSRANAEHLLSGHMDTPLTPEGRKELEILRKTVSYPETDLYFSSPLSRARDTFSILLSPRIPEVREDYIEINFGSLEGSFVESPQASRRYFRNWVHDMTLADEEPYSEVARRSINAMNRTLSILKERNLSSATVVAHSGFLRVYIIETFALDRESFLDIQAPNGLGYVFTYEDGKPVSYRPVTG